MYPAAYIHPFIYITSILIYMSMYSIDTYKICFTNEPNKFYISRN